MPAAQQTKDQVLARLLETFRARGYDGASLADISTATGLGRSSLYHHFPGGKADMARQVLAHLDEELRARAFAPLAGTGKPQAKLDRFVDAIDAFYDGGAKACLLERLAASVDVRSFARPLARVFTTWIDALARLGVEAGLPPRRARERAEDFVVRVEGALVLAAATGDTRVFARVLGELRRTLLARP